MVCRVVCRLRDIATAGKTQPMHPERLHHLLLEQLRPLEEVTALTPEELLAELQALQHAALYGWDMGGADDKGKRLGRDTEELLVDMVSGIFLRVLHGSTGGRLQASTSQGTTDMAMLSAVQCNGAVQFMEPNKAPASTAAAGPLGDDAYGSVVCCSALPPAAAVRSPSSQSCSDQQAPCAHGSAQPTWQLPVPYQPGADAGASDPGGNRPHL
jgi:hypothetical protein